MLNSYDFNYIIVYEDGKHVYSNYSSKTFKFSDVKIFDDFKDAERDLEIASAYGPCEIKILKTEIITLS